MTLDFSLMDRIFEAVPREPGCGMEDLESLFPDLTWNQIFIEVNRLCENGRLLLTLDDEGAFTVRRSNGYGASSKSTI
ncbi:hypothetical protein [Nitrospira sp. Nam80]